MTNVRVDVYRLGGVINFTGEKNFREIIAPLFTNPASRGVKSALHSA
jgi:hypothetical protein